METVEEVLKTRFDHLRGDKFTILFTDGTGIDVKHCYGGVEDAISDLTDTQLSLVVEIYEI